MAISKTKRMEFARMISDDFLKDKESKIANLTQDEIDATIIPIMTDVEDLINAIIAQKIQESIKDGLIDPEDNWDWGDA